jgi:hypothetical protein
MAHPAGPFYRALAAFKTRICCANIRHDTTVPYCTAAICTANPYEQRPPVSVNPQMYPSVVQPAGEAEQGAAFPDAKGRSRMLMFLLFLPLFPLFYSYSVAKGLLHHREAKKKPLDVAWLQQYRAAAEVLGAGLNPFSRQASRQLQTRLQQQQQQQQQQDAQGTGEAGSSAAAAALASPLEHTPFAATAVEGGSRSSRPGVPAGRGLQQPAGRGLQQLLSSSSSSTVSHPSHQQVSSLHMLDGASDVIAATAAAEVGDLDEDACNAAAVDSVELYPAAAAAAAAAEQTEEQLLQASSAGGNELLLSPQASRRLTASGALHEREGIVEADGKESGDAWLLQQQQRWMARQLFDAMPACAVCERQWGVREAAAGGSVGVCECSSGDVGAAGKQQKVENSAQGAAAAADAAVDVQVKGSSTGASGGVNSLTGEVKPAAAANKSSSSSSSSSGSVGVSKGGWHRVDVWTGHMHAHATIIVRDKRYESQSRDLFAYLVNHMSL